MNFLDEMINDLYHRGFTPADIVHRDRDHAVLGFEAREQAEVFKADWGILVGELFDDTGEGESGYWCVDVFPDLTSRPSWAPGGEYPPASSQEEVSA